MSLHLSFPYSGYLCGPAESCYSAFMSPSFLICKVGLQTPVTEMGREDPMG